MRVHSAEFKLEQTRTKLSLENNCFGYSAGHDFGVHIDWKDLGVCLRSRRMATHKESFDAEKKR